MCPTLRKHISTSVEKVGNFLYLGKVRPASVRECTPVGSTTEQPCVQEYVREFMNSKCEHQTTRTVDRSEGTEEEGGGCRIECHTVDMVRTTEWENTQ